MRRKQNPLAELTANLYVFGGNAFPSTGDKHPTLTMMALAARGCDHLLAAARR